MEGRVIRPLRGRVAIRPIIPLRTGLIWHPDQRPETETAEQKSLGKLAQSSHRGRVLGFGPPAMQYERHEVPRGFSVGDEVVFVYGAKGTGESRRGVWEDGEPCVWIAQEEVLAVVERAA
jgi:co-chaperonin GroES (HSP10)